MPSMAKCAVAGSAQRMQLAVALSALRIQLHVMGFARSLTVLVIIARLTRVQFAMPEVHVVLVKDQTNMLYPTLH